MISYKLLSVQYRLYHSPAIQVRHICDCCFPDDFRLFFHMLFSTNLYRTDDITFNQ